MKLIHSLSHHRIHSIWRGIKTRTLNQKNKCYKNYGSRGITICDEWKNSFKSFYDWAMSNGYDDNLTIDRINNNGNYEPSNCRFTDSYTQAKNTRILMSTNTTGYRGASFFKRDNNFVAKIAVNGKRIHIGYFKTVEEAGYAYDKYVIDNNLEHTTNGLYKRGIK